MSITQGLQEIRIRIPREDIERAARDVERLDQVTAKFSKDAGWMHLTLDQEKDELSKKNA